MGNKGSCFNTKQNHDITGNLPDRKGSVRSQQRTGSKKELTSTMNIDDMRAPSID